MSAPVTPIFIDEAEAKGIREARHTSRSGTAEALREGRMVFLPGRRSGAGYHAQMTATGHKLKTRRGERDGVEGIYLWAEKRP